jgi:hypothetical protein
VSSTVIYCRVLTIRYLAGSPVRIVRKKENRLLYLRLTSTEMVRIAARINTYMTAKGHAVYP